MPPKVLLSSSKITRLPQAELLCHLEAWNVEVADGDRDLTLRAKLDAAIASAQSATKSKTPAIADASGAEPSQKNATAEPAALQQLVPSATVHGS